MRVLKEKPESQGSRVIQGRRVFKGTPENKVLKAKPDLTVSKAIQVLGYKEKPDLPALKVTPVQKVLPGRKETPGHKGSKGIQVSKGSKGTQEIKGSKGTPEVGYREKPAS